MNKIAHNILGACCLLFLFLGCQELVEPVNPNLVNLLPGSAGVEGNGKVYVPNGQYLVRHQKKDVNQEINPAGYDRFWHDEDWYAVDADGSVRWIASSAGDIPKAANSAKFTAFFNKQDPAYEITGLVNGESYCVYRYGELLNNNRVGRLTGDIATGCYNTVVNLMNMSSTHVVNLWETSEDTGNRTGGLNDNNHWIVLVDTPLCWTEFPQTIKENNNATILLRGYEYDIEIKMRYPRGWVTAAPVESEGQRYFVITGATTFRGYITVLEKP